MQTQFSWRMSLQAWSSLLLLGLALWLIISGFGVIVLLAKLVFGAFLLSLAIHPIAGLLDHWHIPRGVTVLLVYIGLIGLVILLGALLIPIITTEIDSLQAESPARFESALSQLNNNPIISHWLPSVDKLSQQLVQRLDSILQTGVQALIRIGDFGIHLLVMLVLAYFFEVNFNQLDHLASSWLPQQHRARAIRLTHKLEHRLERWVWAQIGITIYFAVTFSLGLRMFGVPFALSIGIVGGVFEIIPYLGGFIAWLLALFSALTVDPWLAIWTTLLYIAIIQVEAHLIAPALYGHATGIHPAIILIVLVAGAQTGGVLGVFFSVPFAIVVNTILNDLWSQNSQAADKSVSTSSE